MRLLSLLIVATAFGSAGCTQDTALGDPLTTARQPPAACRRLAMAGRSITRHIPPP